MSLACSAIRATRPLRTFISLVMAVAVGASGLSVDEGSLSVRILIGALSSAIMFITIFVVLDHAEAVARRVGEPYGTLVLTLCGRRGLLLPAAGAALATYFRTAASSIKSFAIYSQPSRGLTTAAFDGSCAFARTTYAVFNPHRRAASRS